MSVIGWTDSIGAATLGNAFIYPGSRFANWSPNNRPFGVRSHTLETGALNVTAFRDDLTVAFDIPGIPNTDMAKMLRLQMHLKRGGSVTLNTLPDTTIPVFGDCKLAPGADVQIQLTDKTTLEYTLSTTLRGANALLSTPDGTNEMIIWLKADVPGTLGSVGTDFWGGNPGPEILVWPDQSILPGGNDGTPPLATCRPLWHDAIQNGLPGVWFGPRAPAGFDGVSTVVFPENCIKWDTLPANEAEAFYVLKRNVGWETYNDLNSGFSEFGNGVLGVDYNSHYGYPTSLIIADAFGSTTVHSTGAAPIDLSIPHTYNSVSRTGEWTNRINGVLHYTTAINSVGFPDTGLPNRIAQLGASRPDRFYSFYGWFFEFIFYSPVRTVTQRAAIHSYLATKWGITI